MVFGFGGPGGKKKRRDDDEDSRADKRARGRRRRRRAAAAAAAVALAAGGGSIASRGGPDNVDGPLLNLHNEARRDAGCGALRLNDQLDRAAEGKADEMARTRRMSHTNADGSNFDKRITRTGYQWVSVGENIANGFSSPSSVFSAWMRSPAHRANIVACKFTEIGFGEKDGYFAAEFGRR